MIQNNADVKTPGPMRPNGAGDQRFIQFLLLPSSRPNRCRESPRSFFDESSIDGNWHLTRACRRWNAISSPMLSVGQDHIITKRSQGEDESAS